MPSFIKNAVVNGVLCYISTARDSYNEQALLSICQGFYSLELIDEAKKVLYEITGEPIKQRRGPGKIKADLSDIIAEFKSADEKNFELPIFVSDNFRSMPPASGFEVIADHIITLMDEMGKLKEEIGSLKNPSNGECNSMLDIKEDIHDIKNILIKKKFQDGANSFSGAVKNSGQPGSTAKSSINTHKVQTSSKLQPDVKTTVSKGGYLLPLNNGMKANLSQDLGDGRLNEDEQQQRDKGEWTDVSRRKKRKKDVITGQKKEVTTIKAVQKSLDIYVGRCNASVDCDTLKSYVSDLNMDIDIISCTCLSSNLSDVKSFKISVHLNDRDKLLNAELWPENIIVRKYYKPRYHNGRQQ